MSNKDDGNEAISKRVLDWLTGVGALATLLVTIFGLFLDENKAKLYAFGIAVLLAGVSSGVYFYQRRRAAKLKIAESIEPLSATAALRGLLPFEEGDQLLGRARDIQELYTLVASSTFRFGVLWGESGCGKTSLLRAGLIPKLRNDKFLPLYINKPTNNPQEALRSALSKEIPDLEKQTNKSLKQLLESAVPKGKKIAVFFDQFEEYFLTNRTPKSRASFIKWLGETIANEDLPVVFLVGIRSDFFAQLQNFAPQIPEPTAIRTTYQLQNFDTEQAKQIFSAAAKADGIPFEPALIQTVINELETEDLVRPAELQVVGTRLKRKNIFTLNKYEVLGGARGILSSYIGDEIHQSLNQQVARLILRLMCADVVETKSQMDLSLDDILHGVSGTGQSGDSMISSRPEEIQAILNQFVAARVLIHTDDDKYNLAHDYLAPYVRTATEGVETNTERANRLLKRYVAEYKEDAKTRIPFGRTHWIERYALAEVKAGSKAQELIRKSKRAHYGLIAGLAMPVIIFLGLYFFFLTQSYYFSIDNSHIVLRAGLPQFTFLPGFGDVVLLTEFNRDHLRDPATRNEIDQGTVTGFWFNRAESGYQIWGEQLATRLAPINQAEVLQLLGHSDRAVEILSNMISGRQANELYGDGYYERFGAVSYLGQFAQINPHAVSLNTLKAGMDSMMDILTHPEAEYYDRTQAIQGVAQVAPVNPQLVSPELFQKGMHILIDDLADPRSGSDERWETMESMWQLAQANPQLISPELLQGTMDTLMNILTDSQADYFYERLQALDTMGRLAQIYPQAFHPDMLQVGKDIMLDTFTDPRASSEERYQTMSALWQLAIANPQLISPEILQEVMEILTNPQADYPERLQALGTMGQLAQIYPQAFTPEMLQEMINPLMDILNDPQDNYFDRTQGVRVMGQLAQIYPQAFTADMLQDGMDFMTDILADPQAERYERSQAMEAMAQLAIANPQLINPEILQEVMDSMIDHLDDPQAEYYGLTYEVELITQLAQANSQAITPEMLQTFFEQLEGKDVLNRRLASYMLFVIALTDKDRGKIVRDQLEDLSHSFKPHVRIEAVRALEMLALSDPVKEAKSDPDEIERIKLRLNSISAPNYYYSDLAFDYLRFAARITLIEIEQLEAQIKQ